MADGGSSEITGDSDSDGAHVFRPLAFVTTVQMSLDARAVVGNPHLNRFHLLADLALVVGGIGFGIAGYPIGLLAALFGVLLLLFSQVEPFQRWLIVRNHGSLLGQHVSVEIDDVGLKFSSVLAVTQVPWSTLTAVRTNESTVVFLRERAHIGYLPASAFRSDEERLGLVRFARDRIAGEPQVSRA